MKTSELADRFVTAANTLLNLFFLGALAVKNPFYYYFPTSDSK